MRRRALLASGAATLAGFAGCNGQSNDPSGTEPGTGTDPSTPATDGPLSVELEHVEYGASTWVVSEGRGVDPDDIVPEAEIPDPLHATLLDARADGYETTEVSDALLAGIDDFRSYGRTSIDPYVRLDDAPYEFEPTVPTFTAHLVNETVEDYDPAAVVDEDTYEFDAQSVDEFVQALRAKGTHVPRSEYRTCVVPDPVQTFLENYDYVQDQYGVSRILTEWEDTEPPYEITVRELTDEDLWGRPVVDGSELEPAVRQFFRTAIESDHRAPATLPTRSLYFTDDVPPEVAELTRRRESLPYYRLDGTVYGIGVGSPRYDRLPLSVAVETLTAQSDAQHGRFKLTVTPDAQAAQGPVDRNASFTFTGQGGLPSVLWVTVDGEQYLLDSDAYERAQWRSPDGDSSRGPQPVNEVLELRDHGEPIAATYRIPAEISVGTYVSRGLFRVSWGVPNQTPDEHGSYPFRLRVTVDSV